MIGKFRNEEELIKSYAELEKGFTQKCQQLSSVSAERDILQDECQTLRKQIEDLGGTSTDVPPQDNTVSGKVAPTTAPVTVLEGQDAGRSNGESTEELLQKFFADNPELVSKLLRQAFKDCKSAPSVMRGGGNVSLAQPNRPKTIKEASLMAKELFGK